MMIIEKHPLPSDPTPADAPPSYDALLLTATTAFAGEKTESPIATSSSIPTQTPNTPPKPPRGTPAKGRGPLNWFNFSASRAAREVRTTVLGIVRDLVRQPHANAAASWSILKSCSEACSAYSLSLPSLLQEKSIESHTPIYWAIINRPLNVNDETAVPGPDLLTALLSYSTPLIPETLSEIRLACLLTSDEPLFQRLRMSPEFSSLSGTDEMILGATIAPDKILVENVAGDEGSFAVNFEIVEFQKRMRISKGIKLEFIARGRMWSVSFFVASDELPHNTKPGSWCVSLSLLEHSPPTWVDSRLIIEEPPKSTSPSTATLIIDAPIVDLSRNMSFLSRNKPKPTICLRLKSGNQLVPPSMKHSQADTQIVASVDNSLMAASLQYSDSSYISADGILRARLEARLAKPEAECIIC